MIAQTKAGVFYARLSNKNLLTLVVNKPGRTDTGARQLPGHQTLIGGK